MSSIYDWSTSSSNNANSDELINWAEGQPPSTVNNSARAMMQRLKEYISDVGGAIDATGTQNSINITFKSPITGYFNGLKFLFTAYAYNTGEVVISINGISALPVYKASASGITKLSSGDIITGAIYQVVYNSNLNSGAGGFFLINPSPSSIFPPGFILEYAMPTAPSGWLHLDGKAYSRKDYSSLFSVIGTTYGAGDGSTTFNVPDRRGLVVRGWDNGRGLDSNRKFGSYQEDCNKKHTHNGNTNGAGAHDHEYTRLVPYGRGPDGTNRWTWFIDQARRTSAVGEHSHGFTTYENNDGGHEVRVKNTTGFWIIKT
ncbi:phage tail protein [Bartonella tamiae]|uniref:phage tail protein n=1 Tax=Bartonella tamiae TaxID=373638 RepID=UPI00026E77A2|nr:phage tail protein [Bartonella tamiae]EJF92641.1 hypothetical protein MEG_01811 [Bartonella tamiae Th307]